MRYIHTNDDGSIGLWSTIPLRIVEQEDGSIFIVSGLSRNATQTMLEGHWTNVPFIEFGGVMQPAEKPRSVVIGDQNFDVGDLTADSLPGYSIGFPDFALDIQAKLHADTKAKITGHRQGTKAEIPTDYSFRAAWKDTGSTIAVDMPKARELTRERLRRERAPLLAALDVEAIRAVEAKDEARLAEVAAEKQRLRDITALPAIDAATTPEELKAITTSRSAGLVADDAPPVRDRA